MTEEDLNVKKARPTVRPARVPVGAIRRSLFATSELMRGLSLASADGWRAFSNAVDAEVTTDDDLVRNVTDAVFDSNRRYLESMDQVSRRFVDAMLDESSRISGSVAQEIDYDLLARKVADEMRRRDAAAATVADASDTPASEP